MGVKLVPKADHVHRECIAFALTHIQTDYVRERWEEEAETRGGEVLQFGTLDACKRNYVNTRDDKGVSAPSS